MYNPGENKDKWKYEERSHLESQFMVEFRNGDGCNNKVEKHTKSHENNYTANVKIDIEISVRNS